MHYGLSVMDSCEDLDKNLVKNNKFKNGRAK
jgi:hypothetical protein